MKDGLETHTAARQHGHQEGYLTKEPQICFWNNICNIQYFAKVFSCLAVFYILLDLIFLIIYCNGDPWLLFHSFAVQSLYRTIFVDMFFNLLSHVTLTFESLNHSSIKSPLNEAVS